MHLRTLSLYSILAPLCEQGPTRVNMPEKKRRARVHALPILEEQHTND